jgi:endonuclease YncB( thermonuclease family)
MATTFIYPATVEAVHDADTITVTLVLQRGVDLGFNVVSGDLTMKVALRFLGYDAPELNTPNGKLAQAALARMFEENPGEVIVTSAKWDKYAGRILGGVKHAATGFDFVAAMVASGWLRPYNGSGTKPWSAAGI